MFIIGDYWMIAGWLMWVKQCHFYPPCPGIDYRSHFWWKWGMICSSICSSPPTWPFQCEYIGIIGIYVHHRKRSPAITPALTPSAIELSIWAGIGWAILRAARRFQQQRHQIQRGICGLRARGHPLRLPEWCGERSAKLVFFFPRLSVDFLQRWLPNLSPTTKVVGGW